MKKLLSVLLVVSFLMGISSIKPSALSASSAVLINGDTGEVIYSHNANVRLSMASTTKIMTALLLCESGMLDKSVKITHQMVAVEGSSMGLRAGDEVTYRDLLYGLMLPSGNDAANAIAISLGGSMEGFAAMMNERARELSLENTNFVTPSGLDDKEHYTAAYDLAIIARCAMQNREFAKAAATKSIVLNYGGSEHYLSNHNKLLADEGFIGIKTGFTKKSGRCLVSAYKSEGKYLIAVTLKAPDDWSDHKALVDIGIAALKNVRVTPNPDKTTLPIIGGEQGNIQIDLKPLDITTAKDGDISYRLVLPARLYAPLSRGEKIGEIQYFSQNVIIKTQEICAPYDVGIKEYSISEKFLIIFKEILLAI